MSVRISTCFCKWHIQICTPDTTSNKKTNMIPRKPREGHRETTMPKIMLFRMYHMFHQGCIECLMLQAVRKSGLDKFKHLHQPNAAALFVHIGHTYLTSMKTNMCTHECSHLCRLTKQDARHHTHKQCILFFCLATCAHTSRLQKHEYY